MEHPNLPSDFFSNHLPAQPCMGMASPDDDRCRDLSDLAERRRIQNRIAQRKYRHRLRDRLAELERQVTQGSPSDETLPDRSLNTPPSTTTNSPVSSQSIPPAISHQAAGYMTPYQALRATLNTKHLPLRKGTDLDTNSPTPTIFQLFEYNQSPDTWDEFNPILKHIAPPSQDMPRRAAEIRRQHVLLNKGAGTHLATDDLKISATSPIHGRASSTASDGVASCEEEEELSDSDEQWCTDYSADTPPRIEEDHPLSAYRLPFFQFAWAAYQNRPSSPNEGNGETSSNPTHSSGNNTWRGRGATSTNSGRQRKRARSSESEDDDHSKEGKRRSRPNTGRQPSKRQLCLACPFAKKDPARHRQCYRYVLTRIRDVKQHLGRRHRLPLYCSRCMQTFEDESERDQHIRARDCPERPFAPMEGISERQKLQLGRRVSSKMTEEQQWYTIFDILFPGCARPKSPYVDTELTEELVGFQDFLVDSGPSLLTRFLQQRGEVTSDMPQEERDLASLQETVLADGLQYICERWAEDTRAAGDIVPGDVPSEVSQSLVIPSTDKSMAETDNSQSTPGEEAGFEGSVSHQNIEFPFLAPLEENSGRNTGTGMDVLCENEYDFVLDYQPNFDL
ncbi:hypothetical protein F4802DRAFT_598496 [Xylaria palmicola]|nr:hypothetical protein F4802DRAFT_598496 [Xylaria palmicola]